MVPHTGVAPTSLSRISKSRPTRSTLEAACFTRSIGAPSPGFGFPRKWRSARARIAVPLSGLSCVIVPLQDALFVILIPIASIFKPGGLTYGDSFLKFLGGDSGLEFMKEEAYVIHMSGHAALYVPHGYMSIVLAYAQPLQGKDKRKTKYPPTVALILPTPLKNADKPEADVAKAINKLNTEAFAHKADKEIWKQRKGYYDLFKIGSA